MRILKAKEQAARPDRVEPGKEEVAESAENAQPKTESGTSIAGTLANHKGKLAVGAAAMLGLAVFYKWRESRLARDDPEEYARLRRLKAAVDTEKS